MKTVLHPRTCGPQQLIRTSAGGRLYDRVHRRLVSLPALRMPSRAEEGSETPGDDPASGAGGCSLTVARRACGTVVVIGVRGRMGHEGSAVVGHRIQQILAAGNLSCLVVDLSLVGEIEDSGVRALLRAVDAARVSGIGFRLVAGGDAAARTLDERGVRRILPIAPDVDSACSEVVAPAGTRRDSSLSRPS